MAGKKKILIIDDEESLGWFLKLNLEDKGAYEARFEKSGEAGIAAAREFKPDLILLDIAMPKLDGYQTCERIRKHPAAKNIPVLFLSGKELLPEKIAEHCQNIGLCGFIGKPFTLEALIKKIEELSRSGR